MVRKCICIKKLCSTTSALKFVYLRKTGAMFLFNSAGLHLLSSCLCLHLILWISSARLLTRFDNDLAKNLALSINCNM